MVKDRVGQVPGHVANSEGLLQEHDKPDAGWIA